MLSVSLMHNSLHCHCNVQTIEVWHVSLRYIVTNRSFLQETNVLCFLKYTFLTIWDWLSTVKCFALLINCPNTSKIKLTKHCQLFQMWPCRYLTEEGIAELKGSIEKITLNEIIRIVLDVSSYVLVVNVYLPTSVITGLLISEWINSFWSIWIML